MNLNFLFVFFQMFFLIFSMDPDHDSYFFSARYYDPKLGQFSKADPITPTSHSYGLNRYAYTFNNPFNYADPSGHTPQGPANNDNGTVKFMRQHFKAYRQYEKSNQGFFAKLRYAYKARQINKTYQAYQRREVQTSVFVADSNTVSNAGPKVAEALQQLVGNQATIRARPSSADLDFNQQQYVMNGWFLTYQQNPDNFDNSQSNKAWRDLRRNLDDSIKYSKSKNGKIFIQLSALDSPRGRAIAGTDDSFKQDVLGVTSLVAEAPNTIMVDMIADHGYEQFNLSFNTTHELGHVSDYINNRHTRHYPSPVGYLVYDEPGFAEDNLYRRAYTENNPENPLYSVLPSNAHIGGFVARNAFKAIGIDTTKMKPQEE